MKFKYDMEYVLKITGLSKENISELLKYFNELPLVAKLEAFHISKLIEEEDEFAFLQHHFDKQKIGEYGFSLFILAVNRLYCLETKDTADKNLSLYMLNTIAKMKMLRNRDE